MLYNLNSCLDPHIGVAHFLHRSSPWCRHFRRLLWRFKQRQAVYHRPSLRPRVLETAVDSVYPLDSSVRRVVWNSGWDEKLQPGGSYRLFEDRGTW